MVVQNKNKRPRCVKVGNRPLTFQKMPHIESKNTLIDSFFFENFCLKIQTYVVLKREIRGQIIEFPSSGNVIIAFLIDSSVKHLAHCLFC